MIVQEVMVVFYVLQEEEVGVGYRGKQFDLFHLIINPELADRF